MTACCNDPLGEGQHQATGRIRRVLWVVLAINGAMFLVEMSAGLMAQSVSLRADALDFLGDAANYALSLMVLGMALRWRAAAALVKGATMGLFGLWVIGSAVWAVFTGTEPGALVMGSVGGLALAANLLCAVLLFGFRDGDSNMRSVWLCSRNDAIGNVAVMLAAGGVLATGANWPDLLVAAILAGLALSAATQVFRQAIGELRHRPASA
ncbi:MAG: cation transporter [Alphaproteobacteria bacterium]